MITLGELREMPEARRLFRLFAAAAVVWIAFFFLLLQVKSNSVKLAADVSDGDRVLNAATSYRAYPRSNQAAAAAVDQEPLTVLSQIVDTLQLRDKLQQLQANSSGVQLQMERLYGNELQELLGTVESRGLKIRRTDILVVPVEDERLLNITLLLEQGQ